MDETARASGWDGEYGHPPLAWPDSEEIPSEVYLRVEAMNPWEMFYATAARFCGDYAAWAYGGSLLWQWRRDHGHEGMSMHGPVTPAEAEAWMRDTSH